MIERFMARWRSPADQPLLPKPGEMWQLQPEETPWQEKEYAPVTILDVQDGWVRYDLAGSTFRDQRQRLPVFLQLYRNVSRTKTDYLKREADAARASLPDHIATFEGAIKTTAGEARMVAIFRADLPLPPGKMAVQAGHAFMSAWRQDLRRNEDAALDYADGVQVKIVLLAPDLAALERIKAKADQRGVSAAMITDAARTVLHEPTVTVLGLGPMSKTDCNALTRGLEML